MAKKKSNRRKIFNEYIIEGISKSNPNIPIEDLRYSVRNEVSTPSVSIADFEDYYNPELSMILEDNSLSGEIRRKEIEKYGNKIPYIKSKEIRLRKGRFNTGKISTNLLDSIYDASQRVGIPFEEALGLAGRESTLGIGRGFKEGTEISPTELMSNWQQVQDIINTNSSTEKYNGILKRYGNKESISEEDIDFVRQYFKNEKREIDSTRPIEENPIDNALKYYKKGKYNKNDSKHTNMVKADGKTLMSEPSIQNWLLERENNKYFVGGLLGKLGNWNESATEGLFKHKDSTTGGLTKFGQFAKGFGINSGNIGSIANIGATAIGGALAGGRTSGVGNAMQKVGSLASNIPGVGGLIGAGVNLLGGITNGAFGSKLNAENIAAVEGDIKQALNFTSNAGDYDALASNYAGLQGVRGFDQDFIGKDGWVGGSKAKNKFNSLKTQAEEAEEHQLLALTDNAQNIADTNLQLMEANYTAYGGPINMKYTGIMSPFGNQFDEGGPKNSIPTQEEYIAQQIAAKRAAALDKSRNRTSVRVPMIPNTISEDVWRKTLMEDIGAFEEYLSAAMAEGDTYMANIFKKELDYLLKQEELGYPVMVNASNCMYNAGDCYGLNIPGNLTFASKHRKLGFKKAPKGSMEPGDIVQDVSGGKPFHAMIYDSKDSKGNLLFNYAKGHTGYDAFDMNENYVKQGKYGIPIEYYDVYKYVGTPADSTQWINEYKEMYNKKAEGGPLEDSEYYSIMERVAKDNYKKWGFKNVEEALAYALNDNTYNYRGYYSKYPKSKANADTHWTDEFKTVYHPTFSNESVYSGKVSQYNPEGLIGGSWDGETFIPADWQNKKAEGGELFTNGVTIIGNGGTHESNPYEGVQIGVDPQGIPNLVEEGEVIYNDYVFSNRLRVPKAIRQKYKLRGTTFADAAKQLQKESEERPNDPISKKGLEANMQMLTNEQEKVRMKKESNKYAKGGRVNKCAEGDWLFKPVTPGFVPSKEDILAEMESMYPISLGESTLPIASKIKGSVTFNKGEEQGSKVAPMKTNPLRYAPLGINFAAVANDLFGGNEPDYSNANIFARAIEGTNRPIRTRPIGNYLTYKPFDRDLYINKLNEDASATRRAVMNTSGGNRAAALAGILSTDYNYGIQLGDLARKAEEYNLAQRQQVEDFNRATNTTNAEMGLKADLANAEQAMQRARMYGSLAEYRDKILAANRAEKSANLTNFIQGLGDLGRELTDKDMLRWLTEKGVLKSANGGKINRRKKRGGFTI